jgi:cytoskeleton-associated protein 5
MVRDDSSESRGSSSSAHKPGAAAPPGKAAPSGKMRPGAKVSSSSGPAVVKKAGGGAEDMDGSPLYTANKLKNTRFRDEAKLKLLKWNFASPRQEFVDQLKEQERE